MANYLSKSAALFAELLEHGSIAASKINQGSQQTKTLFTTPITSGIIKKQRSRNGNRYLLLDKTNLLKFIDSEFPNGLLKPFNDDNANRTFGVLTRGDSKTISKLGFDLIMLRCKKELIIGGEQYQLKNTDAAFLSLKISPKQFISINHAHSIIVTVENPTVFTELNKITDLYWDIAIYTAGKISTLLLDQLHQWHQSGHKIIHFGDYDYVGLLEYARILERCPMANLFSPAQLNKTFINQFGCDELLQKQTVQHQSLLKKIDDLPDSTQKQQIIEIHQLLQSTAKGLEQEAFLIQ